jgi:hypothetical protein
MRLLLRGEPATDVRHRAQEDGLGAGDASTHPPDAKRGATQGNAQLVNKGRALAIASKPCVCLPGNSMIRRSRQSPLTTSWRGLFGCSRDGHSSREALI